MEEKVFEGLSHLIYYPEGFREDKTYPLVIFLHGAGARGETTEKLYKNLCLSNILKRKDERQFIILAPHCKGVTWNEWMEPLLRLVAHFRELPYVDKTRVHLTGNSMGGYGTWALATLRPDWFASAMPVCGGGIGGFASYLVDLPIRTFHGLRDTTVDPIESLQMAKAVNLAGGHAELILFPTRPHNIWFEVYDDDKNYDWMLSFTTRETETKVEELSGDYYG